MDLQREFFHLRPKEIQQFKEKITPEVAKKNILVVGEMLIARGENPEEVEKWVEKKLKGYNNAKYILVKNRAELIIN